MNTHRHNPDGEENRSATEQARREVFAAKMQAVPRCPACGKQTSMPFHTCNRTNYPAGVTDANLEADQHAALPEPDETREMEREDKARERKLWP
ncbi:MAG: hypothetical protein ACOYD4_03890 [Solirubrobacterales bacterium]